MQHEAFIQPLDGRQVNKSKWDDCIKSSPHGLIYARTFYLDHLCPNWTALTGKDYEWVLPLCEKRKWGVSYLYQPPFTQQLGVFAKDGVNIPYAEIVGWLKKHYRFWEVSWNYNTAETLLPPAVSVRKGTNYVLDLAKSYSVIEKGYHKDLVKNLKRSRQFSHHYQRTNDYHKCISLYREHYGTRIAHVTNSVYHQFSNVCAYAEKHEMLICRQVTSSEGELMAAALLLRDDKRLYNLMNTTTNAGRKTEANHFLLDALINEFAGHTLLLDFEGSDLPGVKGFYENFGPVNEPYFQLKYNNLPWPLKLFKK